MGRSGRAAVGLACAAIAAIAPSAPRAGELVSLGLEASLGARYLGAGARGAGSPPPAVGDLGATALLALGPLAVGAAAEAAWDGDTLRRLDASALGGLLVPLFPAVLRLELLGEVGVANVRAATPDARGGSGRFQGLRPGLSARIPGLPLRVGAWGLVRWGMPGAGRGPGYGLLGRVGLEF